jgi:hypothetical protein
MGQGRFFRWLPTGLAAGRSRRRWLKLVGDDEAPIDVSRGIGLRLPHVYVGGGERVSERKERTPRSEKRTVIFEVRRCGVPESTPVSKASHPTVFTTLQVSYACPAGFANDVRSTSKKENAIIEELGFVPNTDYKVRLRFTKTIYRGELPKVRVRLLAGVVAFS